MKKIIKYESCDGEIFDTEEECLEHEEEYYPKFSGFSCFDKRLNLLMLDPKNGQDLLWMYLESTYIVIHDIEEATPGLKKIFDCGPLTLEEAGLDHAGYFMWNTQAEDWLDITETVTKLNKLKRNLAKKLKELGRI